MSWLDRKYVSLLSSRVRNFKKKGDSLWAFSCPICGDSETNPHKARGYIYAKGQGLFYRCHNCGHGTTFGNLLRQVSSDLFKDYRMEKFKDANPSSYFEEPESQKIVDEIDLFVMCEKVTDNKEALAYLRKRKIPEDRIESLWFTEHLGSLNLSRYKDVEFVQEPRIIIPIRNRQKQLIGLATRALNYSKLRYINLILRDEPMIYNLENIDLTKTIYVTEGAFDSMFLDNAIAVDGSDFSKLEGMVQKDNTVVIFDNQPRNRQLMKQIKRVAEAGWKVCIWPDDIKEKDINSMVEAGKSPLDIAETINMNTKSGMHLLLRISAWSKVPQRNPVAQE